VKDAINWSREAGGMAVSGSLRVSLFPEVPPAIRLPAWDGLVMEGLQYVPGVAYRVVFVDQPVRDMLPTEMQACADYLRKLLDQYLARAVR
jgi:hypothetical protein